MYYFLHLKTDGPPISAKTTLPEIFASVPDGQIILKLDIEGSECEVCDITKKAILTTNS